METRARRTPPLTLGSTFRSIRRHGISAIINECIISPVLSMTSVMVALAAMLVCLAIMVFADKDWKKTNHQSIVAAISFLLALQVANTGLSAINSGVATLFVCLAEGMRSSPCIFSLACESDAQYVNFAFSLIYTLQIPRPLRAPNDPCTTRLASFTPKLATARLFWLEWSVRAPWVQRARISTKSLPLNGQNTMTWGSPLHQD